MKVDLKRELACYTAKLDTPQVMQVPELRYLMIDGHVLLVGMQQQPGQQVSLLTGAEDRQ